MIQPEFEIGEKVPDTGAFGTIMVMDIFRSITNQDWFCYRVEDEEGTSYLCNEEGLFP